MTLAVEPAIPAVAMPPGRRLSRTLRDIQDEGADSIGVHDLTARMGETAFGALIALFTLPCLIPAPPGLGVLLASPLLLVAAQAALGARAPWLPGIIRRRRISGSRLGQVLRRALPAVERAEAFSQPRLGFLFHPAAERAVGAGCALMALLSMIPIPFAHLAPALSAGILGLALAQRDGVLLIVGTGLAVLSAGLVALGAGALVTVCHLLFPMILGGI